MIQSLALKRLFIWPLLLAGAGLLAWAGIRLAPKLSSLEQLLLITSLAYFLLLLGASGFRMGLAILRSTVLAPLSDGLVLVLGYIVPGILGLIPLLIFNQPSTATWQGTLSALSSPDLLWIPATQAAAMVVLEPHTASVSFNHKSSAARPVALPLALLAGLGLSLAISFIWQISYSLRSVAPLSTPPAAIHYALAILSSVPLAYFSERFLRGRIMQRMLPPGNEKFKGLVVYIALVGLVTFRPFTILPAVLAACLFTWLANREHGVRASVLAHLAFNLGSILINSQFIH